MSLQSTVLLSLIFSFMLYGVESSCTCESKHPQRAVCDATWAFLGKVSKIMDITHSTGEILEQNNTVFVYKVIKGKSKELQDREEIRVITPGENDPCKFNLQIGLKAIFTGELDGDKRMVMNLCNWYIDYSKVPRCQRRSLFKNLYERSCKCTIRRCSGSNCEKKTGMECMIDDNISEGCADSHGYCHHYRGCGVCSWKRCESYYDCQDKVK